MSEQTGTDTTVGAVDSAGIVGLTLHALRLKGMATLSGLTTLTGLDASTLSSVMSTLDVRGWASFMEKRSLWRITPLGREEHGKVVGGLIAEDGRNALAKEYEEEFLAVNTGLKACCADWQLRDGQPNEHDDPVYDEAVIDRLVDLNERARRIIACAAGSAPHLARYPGRLQEALDALRAGETKRFTGFGCDSYHDVWMELHEDLIQLLGIDRAAEGSS